MKLTNYIRDAYVRSVMGDVPDIDYTEKIIKHVTACVIKALPPGVAKVYSDSKTKGFIAHRACSYGGVYVQVPGDCGLPAPQLAGEDHKTLTELAALKVAQQSKRQDLERKIKAAAYGCTTTKGLIELLPEFEKYLPAELEGTGRSLPVIANLMVELVQAGWPKDGRKKPSIKPAAVAA